MTNEEKKYNLAYSFCKGRSCRDCPFSRQFAEKHNIPRVACHRINHESIPNISKVVNLWCDEYDASGKRLQQALSDYDVLDLFNEMTGGWNRLGIINNGQKSGLTYAFCDAYTCNNCPFSRYFAEKHNLVRIQCLDIVNESASDISKVVNIWCSEHDANDGALQSALEFYEVLDVFNDINGGGVNWV